jgi:hypothetical protein
MVDAWPGGLPQRLQVSGASRGMGDATVEYQPDLGPPITRLGATAVAEPLAGTMICTAAQIASFRTFFITTLLRGSLPFHFPDPDTDGADSLLVKFTKQTPPGYAPMGGDTWQLSLSLLVLP